MPNVLVDTGSGGTIFAADVMSAVGIEPQAQDVLHTIYGVGGSEVVFTRKVDVVRVGNFAMRDFEVEVGGMEYGFEIQGILGTDFLIAAGAQINLKDLQIEFSQPL
jgi:hypothetical protein